MTFGSACFGEPSSFVPYMRSSPALTMWPISYPYAGS